MIKKIKNLISRIFGIKQCACPEDEYVDLYTKVSVRQEKLKHCVSHLRFRKSCQACQEIVA